MAIKKSLSGTQHKESVPKRTSIGHGRRKRGSFAANGQKKYRGQGKG
jgi:hypothetical protein